MRLLTKDMGGTMKMIESPMFTTMFTNRGYAGTPVRNSATAQFKKRGNWYVPVNPAAFDLCEMAGTDKLPGSRLPAVQRWFQVEVL